MPTCYMLAGMPGSGKSTFVENVFSYQNVLSTDSYIELIALQQNKTYNEVFKEYIDEATSVLNRHISFHSENNNDFVWDQTNLTVKSRKRKLAMIPPHYKKIAIYFDCDYGTIARRCSARAGKKIPANVLENMWLTKETPTTSEGFDYVYEVYTGSAREPDYNS